MSARRLGPALLVSGLVLLAGGGATAAEAENDAPDSASTSGNVRASQVKSEGSDWELEVALSGHLAVPGAALQVGTDSIGLGMSAFGGVRYRALPLLFGLTIGGDFFAPKARLFVQRDANVAHFWQQQQALWIMPTVRFTPSEGAFRPFLEARGGLWGVLSSNKARDLDAEVSAEFGAAGAAFALATGLTWDFREQAFCVASLSYMRGEALPMTSIDRAEVIDHTFFVVDVVDAPPLEQWVIGLGFGGRL